MNQDGQLAHVIDKYILRCYCEERNLFTYFLRETLFSVLD